MKTTDTFKAIGHTDNRFPVPQRIEGNTEKRALPFWVLLMLFLGGGLAAQETVVLSPTDDIYFQGTRLYADASKLRLDENRQRISYLRFDGSTLQGTIRKAELQLHLFGDSDAANGTVKVYLGKRSNWNETDLCYSNRPRKGTLLASLRSGRKKQHTFSLNPGNLYNGAFTLILEHSGTDNLAYASTEHPSEPLRPTLLLEYVRFDDNANAAPTNATVQLSSSPREHRLHMNNLREQ